MYPNPFYRNVPYRAPAFPPRISPVPFRSPGFPGPGFFGGRFPGAGIPRAGFPGGGAPGFGFPGGRFPGAGFPPTPAPGPGIPSAAANVAAGVAGAAEAAGATAGGAAGVAGGVSSLLAPGRIEQFLQSTGQFMKTAQTYAPYVQQAVPMFKNIPALFRLYKGFQNAPNASENPRPTRSPDRSAPSPKPAKQPQPTPREDYSTKPSLPKIYQPE